MSSAGSTRARKRYKASIALGLFLALAGISMGFWAMYYSSPRGVLEISSATKFVDGAESLRYGLEATGEKIYYEVILSSDSAVNASLEFFRDGDAVGFVDFPNGSSFAERGSVVLLAPPNNVVLSMECGGCHVNYSATLRFYTYDEGTLLLADLAMSAACVAGLGLFLYGLYNYVLSAVAEARETRASR